MPRSTSISPRWEGFPPSSLKFNPADQADPQRDCRTQTVHDREHHTAYIICRQVEQASAGGIDLSKATVAVCGATGDIGSASLPWLPDTRTNVAELLLVAHRAFQGLQAELGRGQILNWRKPRL